MNTEDKVLETVIEAIGYDMLKDVLVKPLEPIMVTKEVTEQIPNGLTDDDGFNLYDTEVKEVEVESDFAKGVVLALPIDGVFELKYKPGDVVVYNKKMAKYFDLYKDSQLVKPYDLVAMAK